MVGMDNHVEVREFLVSRRAQLTPQRAGVPAGSNRRVPGLRRSEVAMLADVSIEYYSRVERGNLAGVSDSVLEAIARAGYTIPLVLTRPDRPKGRGLKLEPSPVKALAASLGIPVLQPATLKSEAARAEALAIPLDVLVVAAYGLILPEAVLAWPRHGCLNVHASKLPRWRGAAPIPRAIEAGDATTGITIMQMDAGLDTGDTVLAESLSIVADETASTLHERLAELGARLIVHALDGAAAGTLRPQAQRDSWERPRFWNCSLDMPLAIFAALDTKPFTSRMPGGHCRRSAGNTQSPSCVRWRMPC